MHHTYQLYEISNFNYFSFAAERFYHLTLLYIIFACKTSFGFHLTQPSTQVVH